MKYEYDSESDNMLIWFTNKETDLKENFGGEIWAKEFKDKIGLMFNNDSKLIGIEILSASENFDLDFLKPPDGSAPASL